jgi:EmrB/QacA subfamily drug resistance transporter
LTPTLRHQGLDIDLSTDTSVAPAPLPPAPPALLAPGRPVAGASRTTPGHRAPRVSRVKRSTLVLAVILSCQLMVVLDGTIVNVALPNIQRALNFSSTELSWVLNAYLLTFGGLLLLGARAGDLLGRRRTFLAGIVIFTGASLVGGFATASWFLLAARALQGVGGALAAPSSLALLTTMFTEGRERLRALGLFTAVSIGGGAIGLVAGGMLTEWASWRWVMFVNVPIGAVVLALGSRVLPETTRKVGRFDLLGALTSTIGIGSVVYGFVNAASGGWTDARTLTAFIAGIVLLTFFVQTERRAAEPITPLRLLAHSSRTSAMVARGLLFAGMYGMFFFLTQFLQNGLGYSSLEAGFAFLPLPVTVFTASQITSRTLVNRINGRVLALIGVSLATIGLLGASQLTLNSSYLPVLACLILFGAGNGLSFISLTSAALAGVPHADAGAASGLINVTQQLGATLGISVLVTIFGAASRHAGHVVGATPVIQAAHAFQYGADHAFAASAGFTVLALILIAIFVRAPRPVRT